jgi:hypothetical protein
MSRRYSGHLALPVQRNICEVICFGFLRCETMLYMIIAHYLIWSLSENDRIEQKSDRHDN